ASHYLPETLVEPFHICVKAHGASGKRFDELPTGPMGLYTYMERLDQGLRQIMAGCRKFKLEYISRDDIASLTKEACDISGIKYVMDIDKAEVEKLLNSK
ncbi:MAG: FMN-binding glutamate synthase family protein, partial [Thermoplasmata archaeon]